MLRGSFFSFLAVLSLSLLLQAQRGGHMGPGAPQPGFAHPVGTTVRGVRGGFGEFRTQRPFRRNPLLLGTPFLYDYADYPVEPPDESQPPVFVAPPQRAAAPPPPAEPLLLEWRGDRWVRVNPTEGISAPAASATGASKAPPPPDAVLIFADGHKEEVSRYMIVGSTMYVSSDYWSTGAWTKKILLSSLDLPASLRANQERGSKLMLPGGPNEVVIGP
jgi:hypothetical protein